MSLDEYIGDIFFVSLMGLLGLYPYSLAFLLFVGAIYLLLKYRRKDKSAGFTAGAILIGGYVLFTLWIYYEIRLSNK